VVPDLGPAADDEVPWRPGRGPAIMVRGQRSRLVEEIAMSQFVIGVDAAGIAALVGVGARHGENLLVVGTRSTGGFTGLHISGVERAGR
jgi:hypothetical protein